MDPSEQHSQPSIGERLEAARVARGLSTRDAADAVRRGGHRISHATIRNYERGRTVPPRPVQEMLAEAYGTDLDTLKRADGTLSGVRYRALKSVPQYARRRFEAEAMSWVRLYCELRRRLPWKDPDFISFSEADKRSPEQLATALREKLGLGDHPVPSVMRALERLDVFVMALDTEARIDAFAAQYGELAVVVVNARLSSDRMRLTAAHELGHHLFEDCSVSAKEAHDPNTDERIAFELGSYFLIPQSKLKAAFEPKSLVRLVEYRERFGISLAAMLNRAERTGLVSRSEAQRLWKRFSQYGWRKREPGFVRPDQPVRLEVAMDSCIELGLMNEQEMSRVAGVPVEDIRKRIARALDADLLVEAAEPAYRFDDYAR